jgi:transposase
MMPGPKLAINWQEDAATLKQMFLKETNLERRPRLHALWLVCSGHSLTQSALLLAVAYSSVHRWLSWYRKGGLVEVLKHPTGGRQGRPGWLNADQHRQLLSEIEDGRFHTAEDIKEHLQRNYGANYRRSGVYSLLRRARVKKKVPRPHHVQADDHAQAEWKKGGSSGS